MVADTLEGFRRAVGAETLTSSVLGPGATIWLDDSGLINPSPVCFAVVAPSKAGSLRPPHVLGFFAGTGVVLGPVSPGGDATSARMNAAQFRPFVRWVVPGMEPDAAALARALCAAVGVFQNPEALDAHWRAVEALTQEALRFTEPA